MSPPVRRVALMQPYFLPYLGYWQLLASVEEFVVYDTAQYVRGSWINRNRIRLGDQLRWLTLPMAHASHRQPINQRRLAPDDGWRRALFDRAAAAYSRAPHRDTGLALLDQILSDPERDLCRFLVRALDVVSARLGISTPKRLASTLDLTPPADRQQRVIALCHAVGATDYFNLSGGSTLYSAQDFRAAGLTLHLRVQPDVLPGTPAGDDQALSILDVVMRRDMEQITELLEGARWATPAATAERDPARSGAEA